MPLNRKVPWLLCYDIANPKRLTKVHKFIRMHAMPLQYSVFFTFATRSSVNQIMQQLESIIDQREDDLRVYPLSKRSPVLLYGNPLTPVKLETKRGTNREGFSKLQAKLEIRVI